MEWARTDVFFIMRLWFCSSGIFGSMMLRNFRNRFVSFHSKTISKIIKWDVANDFGLFSLKHDFLQKKKFNFNVVKIRITLALEIIEVQYIRPTWIWALGYEDLQLVPNHWLLNYNANIATKPLFWASELCFSKHISILPLDFRKIYKRYKGPVYEKYHWLVSIWYGYLTTRLFD